MEYAPTGLAASQDSQRPEPAARCSRGCAVDTQMPGGEFAESQHLNKFVKKANATVMRQAPVITSDFQVSGRTAHFHPYFTKSEVRMEAENTHKKPVTPGEDGLSTPFFTPDSGTTD